MPEKPPKQKMGEAVIAVTFFLFLAALLVWGGTAIFVVARWLASHLWRVLGL